MRKLQEPDLSEVLSDLKTEIINSLNAHTIGVIDSFDSPTQTGEIKIFYKKVINEISYDYPLLVDVPIINLYGGDGFLTFPIQKGDTALVLFNDRDIDNWFEGGGQSDLNTNRTHDLSDGIAIVGIRNKANFIPYSADRVELGWQDTKISLKEKIKLENSAQSFKTILDAFIDEISGSTITIPSGSSAGIYSLDNSAAITAFKTTFGELLE